MNGILSGFFLLVVFAKTAFVRGSDDISRAERSFSHFSYAGGSSYCATHSGANCQEPRSRLLSFKSPDNLHATVLSISESRTGIDIANGGNACMIWVQASLSGIVVKSTHRHQEGPANDLPSTFLVLIGPKIIEQLMEAGEVATLFSDANLQNFRRVLTDFYSALIFRFYQEAPLESHHGRLGFVSALITQPDTSVTVASHQELVADRGIRTWSTLQRILPALRIGRQTHLAQYQRPVTTLVLYATVGIDLRTERSQAKLLAVFVLVLYFLLAYMCQVFQILRPIYR